MEDQVDAGESAGPGSRGGSGTRPITEELLLSRTRCPSVEWIRCLNQSPSPHIQSIENLHGRQRLQVQNLNHVQRMDQLSTLTRIQQLELDHSHIWTDSVPWWLGRTVHLQQNLITSVSRLHSLRSLSELCVSRNPASSLPHPRLSLLYRTPDRLDEQPITEEDRGHTLQRFHTALITTGTFPGELEQEVDLSQSEQSRQQMEVNLSQSEQSRQQREVNLSQSEQSRPQRDAITPPHQQEETNLSVTDHAHTRQHNHKELEQELYAKTQLLEQMRAELSRAFQRLYQVEQELTFYKLDTKLRPLDTCSTWQDGPMDSVDAMDTIDAGTESPYIGKARLMFTSVPSPSGQNPLVDDCRTHGGTDEDGLKMHNQTDEDTQQQETTTHTQVQNQLLVTMYKKQSELEGRLDDTLSRIAMETQEIKELEQQLTDGQILVNEVLQRDLEDIIRGLQQNLSGLRDQARAAEQQIQSLKMENQDLQLHLEDSQKHCRQLQDRDHRHSQLLCVQQGELSELHSQAHTLRGRQVELEAELQHLREELIHQLTQGQDETVTLQQTVHKLQTHLDQTTTQVQQTWTLQRETRNQLDQITASMFQDKEVHGGTDELSPQDLGLCMETHRARTSRTQNNDHMAQLEAQLDQDQDLELASDWRLKEEFQGLRDGLQQSQTRTRLIQQNLETELQQVHLKLEDVQQERDILLSQFHSQSDGHKRAMERMDRKLKRLSKTVCESDQLMPDQLRSSVQQLTHMNHSMDLINTQKTDDVGGVSEQTQAAEDLRTRTSSGNRTRHGGQCCFVPGLSVPSLASQGTQDSGLGYQYFSSPDRGRRQHKVHAGGGGQWVNVETGSEWSNTDRTPPPGPGHGLGLSGPHTPLVCSSCLLSASIPAEGAALHCNIPEHRDLFDRDSDKVDEEKKKLRLESKRLRRTLRRHSRVKLLCEEVECVETTLLKRRAELREADRLLLEARSQIQASRHQIQTSRDQMELIDLQAEDHTSALTETQQHLRELQEVEEELRTRRQMEEQRLKKVEEELEIRKEEKQHLVEDTEAVRQWLSKVSSQCLEAQQHLDSVGVQVQQEEQSLIQIRDQTRSALRTGDELRDQERELQVRIQELSEQQEALAGQTKSTVSALTQDQQRLTSLQTEISSHRAELKGVLQELLSEQQTLEDLSSKRNRNLQRLHRKTDQLETMKGELETTKDELEMTKDELETTKDELEMTKNELETKKDELEMRKDELETTKDELEMMKNQLDKMDKEVNRKTEELVALQQEVESHREKMESCLKETEKQHIDLQDLQEKLSRSSEERRHLQDQCKHLEARRRHAHRCLSAVEAELTTEREEYSRTQLLRQEVMKETTANQEKLKENSELLSVLSGKVEDRKTQLYKLEQEVGGLGQQQQQQREKLTELDREITHKQMVCVGLEDRGRGLEDTGRQMDQQQQHLKQLRRKLQHKEEELQQKEEGLQQKEEELQQKEEGLHHKEEELQQKEEGLRQSEERLQRKQKAQCVKEEELQRIWEELHKKDEDMEGRAEAQGHIFYLSTAGPGSAFGSEASPDSDWEASTCGSGADIQEPRWAELQEPRWAELQTENLRLEEDRLKARLRCRLWTEQENLKVKGLETEESLLGLRHTLDRLDSLLGHTH